MKFCVLIAVLASAMYAQLLPSGLAPASPVPAAPQVPSTTISPDTVVGKVAGMNVTVMDIFKMLQYAPPNLTQQFQKDPKIAIGQYYQLRELTSEAEKLGMDKVSPYKEQFEALYDILKQEILATAMVNQYHDGYNPPSEEVEDYYNKNQSRWAEAKIKVILLNFKPGAAAGLKPGEDADDKLKKLAEEALQGAHTAADRTEEEAKKLASELVQRLRGGEDFAKLVEQYSEDPESKAAGGDFGTSIKSNSSFAQDLKKAVFAMEKGQISDPVRQGNGYYIIRLEEKTVQPMGDVHGEILTQLRDNHRNEVLKDLDTRFKLQVLRPEFFVDPGRYIKQAADAAEAKQAPAPPAPAAKPATN